MYREQFPILKNNPGLIYFDNAATTQKPKTVINKIAEYYENYNSNPGRGVYNIANIATAKIEEVRGKFAEFVGADGSEIVFTKSATEGINLIAECFGENFLDQGDRIVCSVLEHHSNLLPWQRTAAKSDAELVILSIDNETHNITADEAQRKIIAGTKIVAITATSNVIGIKTPMREITELAHSVGAIVLLDCTQLAAHEKINLHSMGVDCAVFSAHKMYGPMGVGVLYINKSLMKKLPPFLLGGGIVEQVNEQFSTFLKGAAKFEAGTQNAEGIISFGEAIDFLNKEAIDKIRKHEMNLTHKLIELLEQNKDITIIEKGPDIPIVSFNIEGIHPHDVASLLDFDSIAIRAGEHCAQPLLKRLGIKSCCRVSFGMYNTIDEVEIFAEKLKTLKKKVSL